MSKPRQSPTEDLEWFKLGLESICSETINRHKQLTNEDDTSKFATNEPPSSLNNFFSKYMLMKSVGVGTAGQVFEAV